MEIKGLSDQLTNQPKDQNFQAREGKENPNRFGLGSSHFGPQRIRFGFLGSMVQSENHNHPVRGKAVSGKGMKPGLG